MSMHGDSALPGNTRFVLNKLFDAPLDDDDLAVIRAGLGGEKNLDTVKEVTDLLLQYSVVLEINRIVSGELSLDVLLPNLIEMIKQRLRAERATLFLHDQDSGELYSRVALGGEVSEIRVGAGAGIVGSVFTSGEILNIADAYKDPRFNPEIDRREGFVTRDILCLPLRNRAGQVFGATQVLNKQGGVFSAGDIALLTTITAHAASALESAQLFEWVEKARAEENRLTDLMTTITSELDLESLLAKIMAASTELLEAERSTICLFDEKADELWSLVAEQAGTKEIRIPSDAGVAGSTFQSGETLNIPDAYADPRFTPEVDRATGFRTRSILCVPVVNKQGVKIGVTQALNKSGGPFTGDDERRLNAFTSQVAAALENAELFDEVLRLKNYNEGILKSLTNGVVTLDPDGVITKVNEAAIRIIGLEEDELLDHRAEALFGNSNPWIVKSLDYVAKGGESDYHADVDLRRPDDGAISVNLTVTSLHDVGGDAMGTMLVLEDITREKRVRASMARYMAKEVVDKLLASGEDVLTGTHQEATVLFSDIRRFTTISEALGTHKTVAMLNDYFGDMVEVIFNHGGILDKYIGDAIMAVFGAPLVSSEDADNAVTVANEMMEALRSFNAGQAAQGREPIEIGIGLSTGDVMAGSIGSLKRMDYTVIGNTVNLAARLESANKHYHTRILLSASTVERCRSRESFRKIDMIRAKGFTQPVELYESIAHYPDETRDKLTRLLPFYSAGLAAYRDRKWPEAIKSFAAALAELPDDGPSRVYHSRCEYYRDNPPAEEWDGVWTMTQK